VTDVERITDAQLLELQKLCRIQIMLGGNAPEMPPIPAVYLLTLVDELIEARKLPPGASS
jgi:hypothetical protein